MDRTILTSVREDILKKLESLFSDKAVEAHIFGSVARGNPDAYSDIDIWYVFKDEEYVDMFEKRFEYYAQIGEIIHSCEPPQNAPTGGVHTALFVKTGGAITVVDIYLCPLSCAFITNESKKLFGIDLPLGTAGFNSQKVQVDNDYRIDFFICFIFNTIKKLARNKEYPLEDVFREYENLYKNYSIPVEPLTLIDQNINTLVKIIENTEKVSNQKQGWALHEIRAFAIRIFPLDTFKV